MLQLVKKPGGAVYALFVALLLSLVASGFSINKGIEEVGSGVFVSQNVFVLLVFLIVLGITLFWLGMEYGVLSVVCAELVFLILFFLSLFTNFYASLALSGLLATGTLAYYMRGKSLEDALEEIGLKSKNISLDVAYGLGGFVAALIVGVAIASILGILGVDDGIAVQEKMSAMPLLVLLWAVSISPLGEEMFFRGLLLQKFGVFPSSILFALMHFSYGSVMEIVGAFAVALILCELVRVRKNIVAPLIAHILFNAFSIVNVLYL